jgi:hypothetical protein
MADAQVSAADVFFGRGAPTERSFRNKIVWSHCDAGDRN